MGSFDAERAPGASAGATCGAVELREFMRSVAQVLHQDISAACFVVDGAIQSEAVGRE